MIRRTPSAALLPSVLAVLAVGAGPLAAQEGRSILELLPLTGTLDRGPAAGTLDTTDPLVEVDRRGEAWRVRVAEPGLWRFDLESDDFDAWMVVTGPGLGWGRSDDDGGGSLDSRLCIELVPGDYTLLASGLAAQVGSYTVEARPVDSEAACGTDPAFVSEEVAFGDLAVTGRLRAGDGAEGILTGRVRMEGEPAEAWEVLVEDRPVEVDVVPDGFDAYLHAEGPDALRRSDDDGGCGLGSRLLLSDPGIHRVVVGSLFEGTGTYTIRIFDEDEAPPVCDEGSDFESDFGYDFDSAAAAGIAPTGRIPMGGTVTGVLGADSPDLNGEQVEVWEIEAPAGPLVIDVAAEFDPRIVFVAEGSGTPLEDDDGGEGTDSRICTVLPVGGVHRLIVRAFWTEGAGSYQVRVGDRHPDDCPPNPLG